MGGRQGGEGSVGKAGMGRCGREGAALPPPPARTATTTPLSWGKEGPVAPAAAVVPAALPFIAAPAPPCTTAAATEQAAAGARGVGCVCIPSSSACTCRQRARCPPCAAAVANTEPNAALRKEDGSYAPAHMLPDARLERAGRQLRVQKQVLPQQQCVARSTGWAAAARRQCMHGRACMRPLACCQSRCRRRRGVSCGVGSRCFAARVGVGQRQCMRAHCTTRPRCAPSCARPPAIRPALCHRLQDSLAGEKCKTAGLLIIGDEILSAKVEDVNTRFLCQELRAIGWRVGKVGGVGVWTVGACWWCVAWVGGVGWGWRPSGATATILPSHAPVPLLCMLCCAGGGGGRRGGHNLPRGAGPVLCLRHRPHSRRPGPDAGRRHNGGARRQGQAGRGWCSGSPCCCLCSPCDCLCLCSASPCCCCCLLLSVAVAAVAACALGNSTVGRRLLSPLLQRRWTSSWRCTRSWSRASEPTLGPTPRARTSKWQRRPQVVPGARGGRRGGLC